MIRTRRLSIAAVVFALAAGLLAAAHYRHAANAGSVAAGQSGPASRLQESKIASNYAALPLGFEENKGQTDSRVKFLARGSNYTVFLTDDESATFALSAPLHAERNARDHAPSSLTATTPAKRMQAVVRLALHGSNPQAPVEGLERQTGRSNYFIGNNPARWQRNVAHYARVKYRDVYPGVDLVYYGHQGQLETDYIVSPGTDPGQIGLRIDGAGTMKLDAEGRLVLGTLAGDVVLHKPVAYQDTPSGKQEIAVNYVQRGPRLVGFRVATYDLREPLIIDPTIVYSTYLGGSGNDDTILSIAVDSSGDFYVTGHTNSTDFPIKGAISGQNTFLSTQVGGQETFISKLKPAGSGAGDLIYSTYLGASGSAKSVDQGSGIAVNSSGEAFVAGTTGASGFPTAGNPLQAIMPNSSSAAFLVHLDSTGSTLLYSTYIGGSGPDDGLGVALDSTGNAYVVGTTASVSGFPTSAGAFQTTLNGASNVFLTRIDTTKPGLTGLIYSTFLGGAGGEQGFAVTADANGNAYVTGSTRSSGTYPTGFPVVNAFQSALAATGVPNAFVSEINTNTAGSSSLVYSTYLGGTGNAGLGDQGNAIALDSGGNVYVTGTTASLNFPVFPNPGAFQTTNHDINQAKLNAFVARFDTTKSGAASLIYSTYLGGSGSIGDQAFAIAVDSQKQAYIAGHTSSNDFPVTPGAPQTVLAGRNAFIAVLNPTGAGLVFGTFWGGTGVEDTTGFGGLALDSASPPNMYLAGDTDSSSGFLTTVGAFQTTNRNTQTHGFITKFSALSGAGAVTLSPGVLAFGNQPVNTTSAPMNATLANGTSSSVSVGLISFSGANSSDFAQSGTTCGASLSAGANCTISVDFTPKTQAAESATLNVGTGAGTQTANLTGTGTAAASVVSATPTSINFGTQTIGTTTPAQTVTLTNNTTTALAGVAITFTGANAADFAQASGGTCTTALAAGANCTINVTFKPSASSLEQAALNIAFTGPAGSPLQVALSGTGTSAAQDFSITASPTSVTVTAGQAAMFSLTVASVNGFSASVSATCTGAPAGAVCTLTPSSVTPAANSSATINGSLTTTKRTIAPPLFQFPSSPRFPTWIWGLASLLFALLTAWTATRRAFRKLAFGFGLLVLLSLSGCSGLPHSGTPPGTYSINVNATSGALKHPASISITVN